MLSHPFWQGFGTGIESAAAAFVTVWIMRYAILRDAILRDAILRDSIQRVAIDRSLGSGKPR